MEYGQKSLKQRSSSLPWNLGVSNVCVHANALRQYSNIAIHTEARLLIDLLARSLHSFIHRIPLAVLILTLLGTLKQPKIQTQRPKVRPRGPGISFSMDRRYAIPNHVPPKLGNCFKMVHPRGFRAP